MCEQHDVALCIRHSTTVLGLGLEFNLWPTAQWHIDMESKCIQFAYWPVGLLIRPYYLLFHSARDSNNWTFIGIETLNRVTFNLLYKMLLYFPPNDTNWKRRTIPSNVIYGPKRSEEQRNTLVSFWEIDSGYSWQYPRSFRSNTRPMKNAESILFFFFILSFKRVGGMPCRVRVWVLVLLIHSAWWSTVATADAPRNFCHSRRSRNDNLKQSIIHVFDENSQTFSKSIKTP